MHTRAQLATQLAGVLDAGDAVFVHSSYKSIGPVDGGAEAVIGAFQDVLTPTGLLVLPSFNLKPKSQDERAASWDPATTPSSVGWLSEYFRLRADVFRSDHYSHAVAAWGAGAADLVAEHGAQTGMRSDWDREPWGRCYGDRSPMLKLMDRPRSQYLFLGVDYTCGTYFHVAEAIRWNETAEGDWRWIDRRARGEQVEAAGIMRHFTLGDADCRIADIPTFVATAVRLTHEQPAAEDWRW
jgi:aminoglycoside 3-N-acetyltransferase